MALTAPAMPLPKGCDWSSPCADRARRRRRVRSFGCLIAIMVMVVDERASQLRQLGCLSGCALDQRAHRRV